MEEYKGVKFNYQFTAHTYPYDQRLQQINHWAFLFAQLGLTPLHSSGAYGNFSYRTGERSFIITKSGMFADKKLITGNYSHVKQYKETGKIFFIEGESPPSSEAILHNALYQNFSKINCIFHGHCQLFNCYAEKLNIPVTDNFYDYGTYELAQSAIRLMDSSVNFFILKNHGFVAVGEDINSTGNLTLDYLKRLINVLRINLD